MIGSVSSVAPLESSPEVFTSFGRKLGLSSHMAFHDIYSLSEPELLAFLPRPNRAIILLFPINEYFESEERDVAAGAESGRTPVTWFKQTVSNACGMYALFHSLSNNQDVLEDDSLLGKFLSGSKKQDGRYEDDKTQSFVHSINHLYDSISQMGQTSVPDPGEIVDLHFVTFVEHDGFLYELDGRKKGPLNLGKKAGQDLLDEPIVKERIQWYIDNADKNMQHQFSLMGLGPSWE